MYSGSGYNLGVPDQTISLSSSLVEISGLSCFSDKKMMAVQDERGILYILDNESGDIERKIKFGKKGDYEGVEYVNGIIYITKSDGTVLYFDFPEEGVEEVIAQNFTTPLSIQNDVEGLGYDPETGNLLFACKEDGEISEKAVKGKPVYAYNIQKAEFIMDPVLTIPHKKINKFCLDNGIEPISKKMVFKPSGIAFHPITKEIYILAHTGKALIVMDRGGAITGYYQLNPGIYRQPEGICFSSDGTLFISNEGRGRSGRVLRFSYSL